MADVAYTITASGNDTGSVFRSSKQDHIAVQLVTAGGYNGTTATATLQESNDGTNWVNILDADGNAVTATISTGTASVYMLKTGIWYGDQLRVNYAAGDASTGTIAVRATTKD